MGIGDWGLGAEPARGELDHARENPRVEPEVAHGAFERCVFAFHVCQYEGFPAGWQGEFSESEKSDIPETTDIADITIGNSGNIGNTAA